MKKYVLTALLSALAAMTIWSCTGNVNEEIVERKSDVRSVTFSAALAEQSRTGLSIKFVPNWINTDIANVHLFETHEGQILEGQDVVMTIKEDTNNEVAYFKADFSEEISIIVNPPSEAPAATRAGDEYSYTAIVAQKADGKYVLPATQYPDEVSLIDPNADFLVGDGVNKFTTSQAETNIDINFVRPVAVSRLAIMNIEGQVIKTVKISSADKLTGAVAYDDVDFEGGTVTFDPESGSEVLTLSYGEGVDAPEEVTFYAYFLSLPGEKRILSVEVTTDKYVYTKTYGTGKTLKFNCVSFKNIAVDMSKVTPVPIGEELPQTQELSFFKDNGTITADSYDLYSTADYVSPVLKGAAEGAEVSYSVACEPEGVATVGTDAQGALVVTPLAVGTAVVTAIASAVPATDTHPGYKVTSVSYTLTVTDSTPAPTVTYYEASTLDSGYEYLIVSAGKALKNAGDGNVPAAVDVTVSEKTITLDATETEGLLWKAADVEESLAEYGTHNLVNATESLYRVGGSSTSTLSASTTPEKPKYAVWSYDGEYLWNISIYTGSGSTTVSQYYVYFNDGWVITTTKNGAVLYTAREPQTLAFTGADDLKYDIYADAEAGFTEPLLDGARTSVSYASSNPAVATVDAESGEVTFVAKGEVTITATAAATDKYQGAVASYVITVTDSTPVPTVTYYKADEVEAGESYLVISNGYFLQNDNGSIAGLEVPAAINPGDASFEIPDDASSLLWTASAATDFTLKNGDYYLNRSSSNVTIGSSGSSLNYVGDSTFLKNSTYYIYYSLNTSPAKWYASTSKASQNSSGGSSRVVYLYSTVKPLAKAGLSFGETTNFNVNLGESFNAPELVNPNNLSVTYASNNVSVATVDPSTGALTILAAGTATITASSEATESFKAGSASYTIVVRDPSTTVTYYKADELKAGVDYLIYSNGYLLQNNSGSVAAVAVELTTDGNIEYADDASALLWSAVAEDSYINFVNGEKYLQRKSTTAIDIASKNSTAKYNQWTYDADKNYLKVSDSGYYLYYSSGFKISSSSGDTHIATLYSTQKPLETQTLEFSAETAKYDLATSTWTEAVPTLSGAKTTVTYASSDTEVATVDPSSGTVTPVARGTAIITATAEEADGYKSAKESYTVKVYNSTDPVSYYTKVTSTDQIDTLSKYIFVYESAGKAFKPVLNSGKTAFSTDTDNAVDVTVSDGKIEEGEVTEACYVRFKFRDPDAVKSAIMVPEADGTTDYYLLVYRSTTSFYASTSGSSYRSTFSITDGVVTVSCQSRYMYYSSSSSAFKTTSTSSSSNLALYKLSD